MDLNNHLNSVRTGSGDGAGSYGERMNGGGAVGASGNELLEHSMMSTVPGGSVGAGVREYESCHDNARLLKAELKAIKEDLRCMTTERDHLRNTLRDRGAGAGGVGERGAGHNYEYLKTQCEHAMNELQQLKQQHSDTVYKCDQAVHAADKYQHKCRVLREEAEHLTSTNSLIQSQFNELMIDRRRLEAEIDTLKRLREEDSREILDLRRRQQQQQRDGRGDCVPTSFENDAYGTAVSRYETLRSEHDALRHNYNDALLAGGQAKAEFQEEKATLREENESLHRRCKESSQQLDAMYAETKRLQAHLTSTMQVDHIDKSALLRELSACRADKEKMERQLAQLMAEKSKQMKDSIHIREERDAAVKENTRIMSERDTVLRETEQLHDRVAELQKRNNSLEEARKTLSDELAQARQALVLNSMEQESSARDHGSNRDAMDFSVEQDRTLDYFDQMISPVAVGGYTGAVGADDVGGAGLGSYMSGGGGGGGSGKEMEGLRKELERTQNELMDALHELEESKTKRNWAFTERDKIVKERESMRTLCDKLRHERDNAVSDLIAALRDTDEIKRQKNDALREINEIRCELEQVLKREACKAQLNSETSHNHSCDSAIDTDLQEWETETLEFNLGGVDSNDLGFELANAEGTGDGQFPNDDAVFVRSIQGNSVAAGKLRVNDRLLSVNGVDVINVDKAIIYQMLINGAGSSTRPPSLHLVVRRRKMTSSRAVLAVHISLAGERELGLSVEQGVYINRIIAGSAAAREGNLAVGDRILQINGVSIENRSAAEALRMMLDLTADRDATHLTLQVLKYCSPTPSLVSSMSPIFTPSSGIGGGFTPSAGVGGGFTGSRSASGGHALTEASSPLRADTRSVSTTDVQQQQTPSEQPRWKSQISYERQLAANWNVPSSSDEGGLARRSIGSELRSCESQTDNLDCPPDGGWGGDIFSSQATANAAQRILSIPVTEGVTKGSRDKKGSGAIGEKMSLFDKAVRAIRQPFMRAHGPGRAVRDARCASTHYGGGVSGRVEEPEMWIDGGERVKENEVLKRLDEGRAGEGGDKDTQTTSASKRKTKWRSKPHGTWPKCRSHIDYTNPRSAWLGAGEDVPAGEPCLETNQASLRVVQKSHRPRLPDVLIGQDIRPSNIVSQITDSNQRVDRAFAERGAPVRGELLRHSLSPHSAQSSDPTSKRPAGTGNEFSRADWLSSSAYNQVDSHRRQGPIVDQQYKGDAENTKDDVIKQFLHSDVARRNRDESRHFDNRPKSALYPSSFKSNPAAVTAGSTFSNQQSLLHSPSSSVRTTGWTEATFVSTSREEGRRAINVAGPTPGFSGEIASSSAGRSAAQSLRTSTSEIPSAKKPTSLDIPPTMYSPRPLPHSGRPTATTQGRAPPNSVTSSQISQVSSHVDSLITISRSSQQIGFVAGGHAKPMHMSHLGAPPYIGAAQTTVISSHTPIAREVVYRPGADRRVGGSDGRIVDEGGEVNRVLLSGDSNVWSEMKRDLTRETTGRDVVNSVTGQVHTTIQSTARPQELASQSAAVSCNHAARTYIASWQPTTPPTASYQSTTSDQWLAGGDQRPYSVNIPLSRDVTHNSDLVPQSSHAYQNLSSNRRRPLYEPYSYQDHNDVSVTSATVLPRHGYYQYYATERIRIPSSSSVVSSSPATTSVSGGLQLSSHNNSFDALCDRLSPTTQPPPIYDRTMSAGRHVVPGNSYSLPKTIPKHQTRTRTRPQVGEMRTIRLEKSIEPLGLHIESVSSVGGGSGSGGGLFVSSVSQNSLASKAGVEIGDQLLEVCGINMRNATKQLASRVLHQCDGSINMLVQYNPNKFEEAEFSCSSDQSMEDVSTNHSGDINRKRSSSQDVLISNDLNSQREVDRDLTNQRELGRDLANQRELGRDLANQREISRDITNQREPIRLPANRIARDKSKEIESFNRDHHMSKSPGHEATTQIASTHFDTSRLSASSRISCAREPSGSLNQMFVRSTGAAVSYHGVGYGGNRMGSGGVSDNSSGEMARIVTAQRNKPSQSYASASVSDSNTTLGLSLIGGNFVGIFVKSVSTASCLAGPKGLRTGDQILRYNGVEFQDITLEQAVQEVLKPCDQITCLALYNIAKFNRVLDLPGDSFYVRMLYSYSPTTGGGLGSEVVGEDTYPRNAENELSFSKGDILYVDNTLAGGTISGRCGLSTWQAWTVDDDGNKIKRGIVTIRRSHRWSADPDDPPSLSHKRSPSDENSSTSDLLIKPSSSRTSLTQQVRRSFFRRRTASPQRVGGGEGRDKIKDKDCTPDRWSASDASIDSDPVSGPLLDDPTQILERIEKLDCSVLRPVLVIGPFAEPIISKLTSESPDKFCLCDKELIPGGVDKSLAEYKAGALDGGGHLESTFIDTLREFMNQNRHCLLNVSAGIVERLQKARIYPIVLFVKHKSLKQIREVKDTRFLPEKVSSRVAKELYDQNQDVEQRYKKYFADVIPGGNLAFMCYKVKIAIDKEQRKTIWISYLPRIPSINTLAASTQSTNIQTPLYL